MQNVEFQYVPNPNEEPRRVKFSGSAEIEGGSEILYEAEGTAEIFQPNAMVSPYQTLNKQDQTYTPTILTVAATLTLETIASSEIGHIRNEFNKTHFAQLQEYFRLLPNHIDGKHYEYICPPGVTVRSSVLKISTQGRPDDNEMFGNPLKITFKTDQLRKLDIVASKPQMQLCLGRIDYENKKWGCVSRTGGPAGDKINTLKSRTMDYEVDRPGTYAVILRPYYKPAQKQDAYMGIILLHKRMFVGLIFFGLPLFIILIGVIIDIISFESKCQDVRLDKDFMREQVFLVLLKKLVQTLGEYHCRFYWPEHC
jgi:hypothetical protein